jgi:uncharacterized protein (TIGR01244 family)
MIRRIDDKISVAPQIDAAMVDEIAAAGFVTIVNNRPDGEEPDADQGDAIAAAAARAGLGYHYIPVTHAGFSATQIEAMSGALAQAQGPVLAYCRSGTRSTNLWALAAASGGEAPDRLIEKAGLAGYDVSGLRPLLETLSGRA